jgi:predicted O-methyltransferase YrrM
MYSAVHLGFKFLQYWVFANNGAGHGVHSPFVYDFIRNVLLPSKGIENNLIEEKRKQLLKNKQSIWVKDLGAGSRLLSGSNRTIQSIAASSLKPPKFGALFTRIIQYYNYKEVLELGTCLGITSSYLATSHPEVKVDTIEGAENIANYAASLFNELGLQNIRLHEGNFDDLLPDILAAKPAPYDFIYVDGNHRYEPTINYFKQLKQHIHEYSVIVFDDIHWSKEMEMAWEFIKADNCVSLTIDLFFVGLVFFRKEHLTPAHFSIRF